MKKIFMLVMVVFALSSTAFGQSAVSGAINGTVTDASNAVIPSATVTLLSLGTNREDTVTTESDGRFKFDNLQPGAYTLTVKLPGFTDYKQEQIPVEVGRTTTVNPTIQVGGAVSEVSVLADVSLVNTETKDFTSNINETAINELPINGRRWSNFVLLTPGVVPDGGFGLLSFRGISGLLNNNTVDGGDNNQAFFGEERGRTRISYSISQSAIKEFQVNTSNYSAEYGRAAGGVTNAVTKSGSNDVHGDFFYFQRNNDWGARNPLAFQTILVNGVSQRVGIKPEDVRHQFGGTVGGPIKKDKFFYFFSYDQQRRNFPGLGVFSTANYLDTVNRNTLQAAGRNLTDAQINDSIAFLTSVSGTVPRRGDQLLLLPKLDWQINDRNSFSVNYNRLRWDSPAGVQTQPTNTRGRSTFGDDFVKIDWGTARLVSTVSSKIVNEVRFQYARDFEYQVSQAPAAGEPRTAKNGSSPNVFLTNGIEFGKPDFLERAKYPEEKRFQFTDNMTVALGSGTLKFGADFNHVKDVLSNLRFESGGYSYSNINDFIIDYVNWKTPLAPTVTCSTTTRFAGRCYTSNYSQGFGELATRFSTTDYNFYAQYDWKPSPRLTVNTGLRYEYQKLPEVLNPNPSTDAIPNTSLTVNAATSSLPNDKNNFGPRAGFALDLTGDGRTSIRSGYGLYYGRLINSTIYNGLINTGATGGTTQTQVSIAPTAATAPIFPNVLASAPAGTGAIQFFSSDYGSPKIHQADFIFERQITRGTTVQASYLLSLGRSLPSFHDKNLNAPSLTQTYTLVGGPLDGQTVTVPAFRGARPNTNFGVMTEMGSKVKSKYNAMVLQLNRRMTNGLQFQFNYTLSKSIDNLQTSQTFSTSNVPYNVFDPDADRGRSNFDRRHKVVVNAVYQPRVTNGGVFKAVADGWTISPIYTYYSGIAVDPFVSGTMPAASPVLPTVPNSTASGINGSGGRSRLPIVERNGYSGPGVWNVDLRLSRRFFIGEKANVEALIEGFNIFNRTNITNVNNTFYQISGTAQAALMSYQTSFLTPSETGTNFLARERQVQLGFRFHF